MPGVDCRDVIQASLLKEAYTGKSIEIYCGERLEGNPWKGDYAGNIFEGSLYKEVY